MKCTECGQEMKATKEARFHYLASGLSNIFLNGVIIYKCSNKSCHEIETEIPRTVELHNVIAENLAMQPSKLLPQEIRFLRTHIGLSGVDFAKMMGVDAATVSRWENGKLPMGIIAERLLRVVILDKIDFEIDYEKFDMTAKAPAHETSKKLLKFSHNNWMAA